MKWKRVRSRRDRHQLRGRPALSREPGRRERALGPQELQADCYASVWAATSFAEGDLEQGDIDEAFGAAEAAGDGRLQEQAGQRVDPDSFTHGTSQQRREWFERGYSSGRPADCDTFSAESL